MIDPSSMFLKTPKNKNGYGPENFLGNSENKLNNVLSFFN